MTALLLTMAVWTGASAPAATLPLTIDVTPIRELAVQHDGRWPPVDTVARDVIEDVTGTLFFEGHDPVLLLLAMTFDRKTWEVEPLIPISNAELRAELSLPADQTLYSYRDLVMHKPLRDLSAQLAQKDSKEKLNPLEAKVSSINGKLGTLQDIFSDGVIRPIPDPEHAGGRWSSLSEYQGPRTGKVAEALAAWQQMREAFLADRGGDFAAAADKYVAALVALPAVYRPSAKMIKTELWYNKFNPYRKAWVLLVTGALLAALAMFVKQKWADVLTGVVIVAGFATLSYGIWLRWTICGHIPSSNMFESLLFLSWGMALFAILAMFAFSQRLVLVTASSVAAIALMLSDILPIDGFIRPTTPVLLDTMWMAIHVPVIMVSYSVLALGVVIAHGQLITMAFMPERKSWVSAIDTLHYWYIHVGSILLAVGIMTGSMWAASSWGRYWGWDPKEVWSLVALLGYLTILHVRIDTERVPGWAYLLALVMGVGLFCLIVPTLAPMSVGKLLGLGGAAVGMVVFVVAQGPFATAFKSVLAFWLIIMTYVGVNYVLGIGLHSYGFGTGAVVKYMFRSGTIDLSFVLFCTIIYLVRRPWTKAPASLAAPA